MLSKKDIEARHYWADHLDGEHGIDWPQCQKLLCESGGFCCLGVAAAIGLAQSDSVGKDEDDHTLVLPFAGYTCHDIGGFSQLNDGYDASFSEIADVIRLSCLPSNQERSMVDLFFDSATDDPDDDKDRFMELE